MTWFDFLSLFILIYFVIRSFFRGILRSLFSLIGMVIAFLYAGWFSPKIQDYIAMFIFHPKAQIFLSLILAFFLIYFTFVLAGYILFVMLKTLNLSIVDRFLGALLGFIKGTILITFFHLLFTLTIPQERKTIESSLTYPLVKRTLSLTKQFLPKDMIDAFEKTKKIKDLPKELLPKGFP